MVLDSANGCNDESVNEKMAGAEKESPRSCEMKGEEESMLIQTQGWT